MRAILILLEGVEVPIERGEAPPPRPVLDGEALAALDVPTLLSLGLGEIVHGRVYDPPARKCSASYGRLRRQSAEGGALGALWELAGAAPHAPFLLTQPLPTEWLQQSAQSVQTTFFYAPEATTPQEALARLEQEEPGRIVPVIFAPHASTLALVAQEGGLDASTFWTLCRQLRSLGDEVQLPVLEGYYLSTQAEMERKVFGLVPPRTIFNALSELGFSVEVIGPVADAFGGSGLTRIHPEEAGLLATVYDQWENLERGVIIGKLTPVLPDGRMNPSVWEALNDWLAEWLEEAEGDDLLLLAGTSPHQGGQSPVLLCYDGRTGPLGIRESLGDLAATLGAFFNLQQGDGRPWPTGTPLTAFHRAPGSLIP